jgi:hypothetical protein
MSAVPMCKLCDEYEIGTFQVHNDFCSDVCADRAYDYLGAADFSFEMVHEDRYSYEMEDFESFDAEDMNSFSWL